MSFLGQFRVLPGAKVILKVIESAFKGHHESRKQAAVETEYYQNKLRELQELFYAERQGALLICLQAMDARGKDGTIRHVLGSMNSGLSSALG